MGLRNVHYGGYLEGRLEGSEEEFGPEFEMSSILCCISSMCLFRSLFTLVHFVLGRTSVGLLVLQLLVRFSQCRALAGSWKKGEKVRLKYLLCWLLKKLRWQLGLAVSPK